MNRGVLRLIKGSPFKTLQGEGSSIGTPTVFIRTAGCDLRCVRIGKTGFTCDTLESLPDYDHKKLKFLDEPTTAAYEIEVERLATVIRTIADQTDPLNLVYTGGEPTLQADNLALLSAVLFETTSIGSITLESNARHFNEELAEWIDLVSLSPKLQVWSKLEMDVVFRWLSLVASRQEKQIQLKIVCANVDDYYKAKEIFEWAKKLCPVNCIIQPAYGVTDLAALSSTLIHDKTGSYIRLIVQSHKVLGLP